jgi:hypothetical protein
MGADSSKIGLFIEDLSPVADINEPVIQYERHGIGVIGADGLKADLLQMPYGIKSGLIRIAHCGS